MSEETETPPAAPAAAPAPAVVPAATDAKLPQVQGSKLVKTLGVGAAVGIGSAAIVAALMFANRGKNKA